jgi:hypothetical protein
LYTYSVDIPNDPLTKDGDSSISMRTENEQVGATFLSALALAFQVNVIIYCDRVVDNQGGHIRHALFILML